MNADKHTPAPWDFTPNLSGSENHRGFRVFDCAKSWVLATVIPVDEDGIEGGANARLMAAAPELLAALRSFVHEFGDKTNRATFNKARAAIAKATA